MSTDSGRARPLLSEDDIGYMRESIAQAKLALASGDMPFGAVIVDPDGQILARSFDTAIRDGDPTAHAEFKVALEAYRIRGRDLGGCAMYCNGEPCVMCFGSAWYTGVSWLFFGVSMAEIKALRDDSMEEVFGSIHDLNRTLDRQVEIIGGALYDECRAFWA